MSHRFFLHCYVMLIQYNISYPQHQQSGRLLFCLLQIKSLFLYRKYGPDNRKVPKKATIFIYYLLSKGI